MGDARAHADDGITKHAEVGAAALCFDRVARLRIAWVVVNDGGAGEMPAGAAAHDADAAGIDFPLGGLAANEADGALGVVLHDRMAVAISAQAVFEDKTVDSMCGEILGVAFALMPGEPLIGSAGADDDGGAA